MIVVVIDGGDNGATVQILVDDKLWNEGWLYGEAGESVQSRIVAAIDEIVDDGPPDFS